MKRRITAFIALLVCGSAVVAAGDWNPGDPHKMHYPQLPDPNGWDVAWNAGWLADDWTCSETGRITDVHFWVSWHGDEIQPITVVGMSVYSDDRTGPYSKPGALLWGSYNVTTACTFRPYGTGSQGWYNPETGVAIDPDHTQYWQVNVDLAQGTIPPLTQQEGTIYWLALSVTGGEIGWKTSGAPHHEDDAVWFKSFGEPPLGWQELRDPQDPGVSLDQAFVIVPEPGTGALLLLFGAAAMAHRRLRRR